MLAKLRTFSLLGIEAVPRGSGSRAVRAFLWQPRRCAAIAAVACSRTVAPR